MERETKKIYGVIAIEITDQEWKDIKKRGKGMYHIFLHGKHWIPLDRKDEYLATYH